MCEWTRFTIVADIVLALVINTSATLLAGAPMELMSWYPYTCVAFGTNVVLQLILPVHGWAQGLSGWASDKSWGWLVEVFFENLIFVTCISLTEAYVHVGLEGIFAEWIATYAPLVLIGYVTSLVLCRVGARFTEAAK